MTKRCLKGELQCKTTQKLGKEGPKIRLSTLIVFQIDPPIKFLKIHKSGETVEHILVSCEAYEETNLWLSTPDPHVLLLVIEALISGPNYLLQSILDCSVLPSVIRVKQRYGSDIKSMLFYLTCTWCYAIHRKRMKTS